MSLLFAPRPNDKQPWDADAIERLHAMLAMETPIPIVARELGRSQEAVRRKARLLDRLPA